MRGVLGLGPGCRAQYDQQWLLPNCICRLCTIHKSEAFSSAEAGEIPFGVCLCLSRPASALVAGGDPLLRRDAISLESQHPREAGCFHDLALCSPIFHKTTGQTQSTALFPSHPPSDLASEGKAPWRKGVAGFRGTLRNTKLKTHSRTDVTLLGYSSQAGRQSHFLGNAPTPRCLLFADQKLEGKLL